MNEEEKLKRIFNQSGGLASTSEIDEAWKAILPDLNALSAERRRKRTVLFFAVTIPVIFASVFVAGYIYNNKEEVKTSIAIAPVPSELPEIPNSLNTLPAEQSITQKPKTNTTKNNSFFMKKQGRLGAFSNLTHLSPSVNPSPVMEAPGSVISTAPAENRQIDLPASKRIGQSAIARANESFLTPNYRIAHPLLYPLSPKNKWQFGMGLLYSYNPVFEFNTKNEKPWDRIGVAAFVNYRLLHKIQLGTELNLEPYKTNYFINYRTLYNRQFEQVQLSRIYYFHGVLKMGYQFAPKWTANAGFYYARMLNKYQSTVNMVEEDQKGAITTMSNIAQTMKHDIQYFGLNRNDLGLMLGIACSGRIGEVELRYSQGFSNVLANSSDAYKNKHLGLKFGYYLFQK